MKHINVHLWEILAQKAVTIVQVFANKTRIYTGTGALHALECLNSKRLLVVTDPYFAKNGMAQKVAQAAKAEEVPAT